MLSDPQVRERLQRMRQERLRREAEAAKKVADKHTKSDGSNADAVDPVEELPECVKLAGPM